jgi:hypothetical protein
LAQQLSAVGEIVLDVPPTLSARAPPLDTARIDKTDAHDALRRGGCVAARKASNRRAQIPIQGNLARLRRVVATAVPDLVVCMWDLRTGRADEIRARLCRHQRIDICPEERDAAM